MSLDNQPEVVKVKGTQLLPGDLRDHYRQKIARITLDSMVQFVGLLDARGTVLEINQVALDAIGIDLSEVEGRPFWTTFWWQVSEPIRSELRESIRRAAEGEFVRWDTEIYGRAGGKETIIIDASLCPVRDDQGRVVFIAAEGRDITEKKAQEREIARQREELARLDVLKTQFFANVSHEFRTPLTLMLGPLEDALGNVHGILPLGAARDLSISHRNALRLLKLVNIMLDFSRIEAGRGEAFYEPTDLAALTAELASNFRSLCEKAGLRLAVDCASFEADPPAYVDRSMWEKIVLNLLSNAFKFTHEGEIDVRLQVVQDRACLTVRDTGVGIPSWELPRMFERFHRSEQTRGRTYEGSGIGLALVKELVKLHGGSVDVDSTQGEGSTFSVIFPLGKAHLDENRVERPTERADASNSRSAYMVEALHWLPDEPTLHHRETAASQAPRILWADDNADMRGYVRRLLSGRFDVETVSDGEEALQAARAFPPDLILSDVMMPKLDGFGLLRAVREDPNLRDIPVILLSARAGEESRIEGVQAGADDYLAKPFSARELLARVEANLKLSRLRLQAKSTVNSTRARLSLLEAVFESSPDAIFTEDCAGMITSWNRAAQLLFGYSAQEVVGKPAAKFIASGCEARRNGPIDCLRKDGASVRVSLTVSPLNDAAGKGLGVSNVARPL